MSPLAQFDAERFILEKHSPVPKGVDPSFPLADQKMVLKASQIFDASTAKNGEVVWAYDEITGLPEGMFFSGGDSGSPARFHTCAIQFEAAQNGTQVGFIVKSVILLCPKCHNTLQINASDVGEIRVHFNRCRRHPLDNKLRPEVEIPAWTCTYHLNEDGVTGPCRGAFGVIKGKLVKARPMRD